jgi:hypothetical protein
MTSMMRKQVKCSSLKSKQQMEVVIIALIWWAIQQAKQAKSESK